MENNVLIIINDLIKLLELQILLITKNQTSSLKELMQKEEILLYNIQDLKSKFLKNQINQQILDLALKFNNLVHKRDFLIKKKLIINKKIFSIFEKDNVVYQNYNKKRSNKKSFISLNINKEQ